MNCLGSGNSLNLTSTLYVYLIKSYINIRLECNTRDFWGIDINETDTEKKGNVTGHTMMIVNEKTSKKKSEPISIPITIVPNRFSMSITRFFFCYLL